MLTHPTLEKLRELRLMRIPVNVTADSAVRDRCAARCVLGRVH